MSVYAILSKKEEVFVRAGDVWVVHREEREARVLKDATDLDDRTFSRLTAFFLAED